MPIKLGWPCRCPTEQKECDFLVDLSPMPKTWADKIAARMKTVFLARTATEWERIFEEETNTSRTAALAARVDQTTITQDTRA
ncbi:MULTISPECIES: hypothetical protein [unclassified Bradyrhizobium]|uniref:hypothetical protein n=1 Tax=unclassified Bradyrhizobium TaxID=2631580 RepID=UPI0023EEEFFA|nr:MULTISPECIES: hypothetical protein [unclassified Bradyrhizobium]MCK1612274.1 hypothetical protein [Bradyrhizobium sp. 163]MCK1767372.1 hypothetical protein [Bradyrhizobium sp. 136]